MSARVLAAVVLAVAAGLRFWALDRVGITHWDAGAYTAGPRGVGPYGEASLIPFYAPPLVPALHAALFAVTGFVDTAAIALHATVGTLTVAALWAFGRRLVGAREALFGAAALASMAYHVVFSRQPTTDVVFTALFVASLAALWRAVDLGGRGTTSRGAAVLAGLLVGATFATKYHGFFPLVVVALVLGARRCGLVRGADRCAPPRRQWAALVLAAGVSAAPAALVLWHIHAEVGFEAFEENRRAWLPEPGLHVIPQTLRYIWNALTTWTSVLVFAGAAVGIVAMSRRRTVGDVLVLAWVALFVATLPLYQNYPRLLVPMLPALALAAGVGLVLVVRARLPDAVVVAAVLALGAWGSADFVTERTRGYADVAAWLAEQPVEPGAVDVFVTQHAVLPYLADAEQPFVTYDSDGSLEALVARRVRYVVTDLRLPAVDRFMVYLDIHRNEFEEIATIDNPIPAPFAVNLLGFDRWDAWRSGRLAEDDAKILSSLRVYRRRE